MAFALALILALFLPNIQQLSWLKSAENARQINGTISLDVFPYPKKTKVQRRTNPFLISANSSRNPFK